MTGLNRARSFAENDAPDIVVLISELDFFCSGPVRGFRGCHRRPSVLDEDFQDLVVHLAAGGLDGYFLSRGVADEGPGDGGIYR